MKQHETLRVLTWNIRHGGSDAERLAQAIGEIGPDMAVLTEFRPQRGLDLLERLRERGWPHAAVSAALPKQNGVAVVSRSPVVRGATEPPAACERGWVHVANRTAGLEILGLYVPAGTDGPATRVAKRRFWDAILASAEALALAGRPAMLVGDLNTGRHRVDEEGATYVCSEAFEALGERGWQDAFRALHGDRREYSWWSNRGGFRLDHAFVSTALRPRLRGASYLTRTPGFRLVTPGVRPVPAESPPPLSDHSALLVEVARA